VACGGEEWSVVDRSGVWRGVDVWRGGEEWQSWSEAYEEEWSVKKRVEKSVVE
jgi:hypothetical protein